MVRSLWKGMLPKPFGPLYITRQVAERHGLTVQDLKGPDRHRHIAWARQEAMAAIYASCNVSLPWIGRYFGGRDHTTVLWAIRAVKAREAGDKCRLSQPHRETEGAI